MSGSRPLPLSRDKTSARGCQSNRANSPAVRSFSLTMRRGLRIFESELFAFPNGPHDDQVDAISQALAYEISGYNLDGFARWGRSFTFGERYGIWW